MSYDNFDNNVFATLPAGGLGCEELNQATTQAKEAVQQAILDAHHAKAFYHERKNYWSESIVTGILESLCTLVLSFNEMSIRTPMESLSSFLDLLEIFHKYDIRGEKQLERFVCWYYYANKQNLIQFDRMRVANCFGNIMFPLDDDDIKTESSEWSEGLYADSSDERRDNDSVIDVDAMDEEEEVEIISEGEFIWGLSSYALDHYRKVENQRKKKKLLDEIKEMLRRNPQ